jgi:hypothetical protein
MNAWRVPRGTTSTPPTRSTCSVPSTDEVEGEFLAGLLERVKKRIATPAAPPRVAEVTVVIPTAAGGAVGVTAVGEWQNSLFRSTASPPTRESDRFRRKGVSANGEADRYRKGRWLLHKPPTSPLDPC